MVAIQARPTFLLETELSESEIMPRIKDSISKLSDQLEGQFTSQHAMICFTESKRHFWSPWVQLEIRSEEQCRQVFGRFTPNPAIWTAFIFAWLAIGVLVFFAIMLGVSQQLTGLSPWAYFAVPVGAAIAFALWLASQAGQKLAHQEMHLMKSMIEECLQIDQQS